MKLKIKKKYFDMIQSGLKSVEYRDAHITFVCEETGQELRKEVIAVELLNKEYLPYNLRGVDMFKDDVQIHFMLKDTPNTEEKNK